MLASRSQMSRHILWWEGQGALEVLFIRVLILSWAPRQHGIASQGPTP